MAGKTIRVTTTYGQEPQVCSFDIAARLADLPGVSSELASGINDETTRLLNIKNAI